MLPPTWVRGQRQSQVSSSVSSDYIQDTRAYGQMDIASVLGLHCMHKYIYDTNINK